MDTGSNGESQKFVEVSNGNSVPSLRKGNNGKEYVVRPLKSTRKRMDNNIRSILGKLDTLYHRKDDTEKELKALNPGELFVKKSFELLKNKLEDIQVEIDYLESALEEQRSLKRAHRAKINFVRINRFG